MRLTKEHFDQALSSNGGYSQKQLKLLGVNIKKAGWKFRAMRKDYPLEVIEKFIALKDAHLVDGQNVFQRGEMKLPKRWQRKPDPDRIEEQERMKRFEYQINKDEIDGQILWFEALKDSVEDDDKESAIAAINGAIGLLRKEMRDDE